MIIEKLGHAGPFSHQNSNGAPSNPGTPGVNKSCNGHPPATAVPIPSQVPAPRWKVFGDEGAAEGAAEAAAAALGAVVAAQVPGPLGAAAGSMQLSRPRAGKTP